MKDIAVRFSCSRRTIERHLQHFQLRSCDYRTMSDADLDELVGHVVLLHPQCGQKTIRGQLKDLTHRLRTQPEDK